MSKQIKLTANGIGGDVQLMDIYHTAPLTASYLISSSVTPAQLTGSAGLMQKENANIGCIFNMGGSGVANYCSILEASK